MKIRFFPSFYDHPSNMRFMEQEENEYIELLLRRHWVTNVPWSIVSLFGTIFPYLLIQLLPLIGLNNLFPQIPNFLIYGSLVLWHMLIMAYVIENFLFWYFNIYVVTNLHLVDVNFDTILHREIIEVGLENIELPSSKIVGLIRSFFNYGDVVVQTAAEHTSITFLAVPHPDLVADRINDLRVERSNQLGNVT